ncbi:MAG TPA: S-adenosylmethionine:tRNA ribosyltransferase-isomerase, partial [Polyangiaceae bacterium]
MLTSNFDYELPERCIALHPPTERDGARMLIVSGSSLIDERVSNFCEIVAPGSLVVVNDSRVRRARVLARRRCTGGRVEFLLLERLACADGAIGPERWKALGRPARLLRSNEWFDG